MATWDYKMNKQTMGYIVKQKYVDICIMISYDAKQIKHHCKCEEWKELIYLRI